jgi:hypothetical protein
MRSQQFLGGRLKMAANVKCFSEALRRQAATRLTPCRCCGGELARPGLALVG